jgi:hypothetical protein
MRIAGREPHKSVSLSVEDVAGLMMVSRKREEGFLSI